MITLLEIINGIRIRVRRFYRTHTHGVNQYRRIP